jgi:hypothetical protein
MTILDLRFDIAEGAILLPGMMKRFNLKYILAVVTGFYLTGCRPDPALLPGKWQAAAFYEDYKYVTTPLGSVSLYLTPEGGYTFRSQGYYREDGTYRVSGAYLALTDTTRRPHKERTIKVLHVSTDTLKVLMTSDKKRQVLFLAKVK